MESIAFTLMIDGLPVTVRYTPNRFTSFPVGHLEFMSPHTPPRPIPVSRTGYRSHFAPMPDIEAAPNVEAYARALALAWLHPKRRDTTQEPYDLFSEAGQD